MIETRRLKNVVIFIQTILNFVLSRKIKKIFVVKNSLKGMKLQVRDSSNIHSGPCHRAVHPACCRDSRSGWERCAEI